MKKITYKSSGVNIRAADRFTRKIKSLVSRTKQNKALSKIGSFAGLYQFASKKYKDPVLVSSTDGVGTKLKVAQLANKHDTVGIDLVAMNVNDILCLGARPLFFLDYIACGKLKNPTLLEVMKGVSRGCIEADCSLIGGETAEMPGMYKKDEYDLAGFTVGVVERKRLIKGSNIKAKDKVIGIASSGLHSNGFSLVRKIFSKNELLRYSKELLKPTRIYVKPILSILYGKDKNLAGSIKGIAHITGGAFFGKIPRIIPSGLGIKIVRKSWPIPRAFKFIKKEADIAEKEMYNTFNMGIGMVLVASPKNTNGIIRKLSGFGLESWIIGEVVKANKKIQLI